MARLNGISKNLNAFLDMIAYSEGTPRIPNGDGGYGVIVGGTTFHSYRDHPRCLVTLSPTLKSTAAGRYQLLARYFDAYKRSLVLPDFTPASQDTIAIQQIKECRALDLIEKGDISTAISACAHIWASLPGAGYGQRENKIDALIAAYTTYGGASVTYVTYGGAIA